MKRPLRIFSDNAFDASVLDLLRHGVGEHELVVPNQTVASVLSTSRHGLDGFDVILGQPDPAQVLASGTVRWVHVTSAGYTRYDTPEFRAAAKEKGIVFTNSSRVFDRPCAEQLMAFILAETRALPRSLEVRCANTEPEWKELRRACRLLRDESVLILGYGAIAKILVTMLAPFGPRVSALRRHPQGDEAVPMIRPEDLAQALAAADHVVNILPAHEGTRHFINAERLGQMKPGAAFYNIGRGTTVDQAALAGTLRTGHLGSAWLDVTDPEPLPADHPLRALENCHITPHIAGGHRNESENLIRFFLEHFHQFLEGAPLSDRILWH